MTALPLLISPHFTVELFEGVVYFFCFHFLSYGFVLDLLFSIQEVAPVMVTDNIGTAEFSSEFWALISLDLSAAFNTINLFFPSGDFSSLSFSYFHSLHIFSSSVDYSDSDFFSDLIQITSSHNPHLTHLEILLMLMTICCHNLLCLSL